MVDSDAVLYEARNRVGWITLNRPDNRNSMTLDLLDAFREATARARADEELRAVVITGKGRCFCGGADLRAAVQRGHESLRPAERSYAMYEAFLSVLDIEVPVIAAVRGHAVGGGFGLALLADIRLANREARMGANFARIGIAPGLGISYTLPRLVGKERAAELLFTGRLVTGEEAARLGIAHSALPPDRVVDEAGMLAATIAKNAPVAVRMAKRLLRGEHAARVREAARGEAVLQAESLTTEDAKEGMAALLDKREPIFHGR